jgi:hypothetical protein
MYKTVYADQMLLYQKSMSSAAWIFRVVMEFKCYIWIQWKLVVFNIIINIIIISLSLGLCIRVELRIY